MKPSKCLAKEKGKQIGKKRERRGEGGENAKESKYKTLSQNFASCTSPNLRSGKFARLHGRPQSTQLFINGV